MRVSDWAAVKRFGPNCAVRVSASAVESPSSASAPVSRRTSSAGRVCHAVSLAGASSAGAGWVGGVTVPSYET